MFFDNWKGVYRIIIMALLTYPTLVFILRVSGKRTLSKMNMFDLVITVAIGSSFATIILSDKIAFVEGFTAITMLTLLQFIVTWISVRSKKFTELIKSEPRLLYYQGEYLDKALREERVRVGEIRQSIRTSSIASMDKVDAVILETDGSMSVVKKDSKKEHQTDTSMKGVKGMEKVK
ncbi:DUF421 domain-containing protein [Pseudalkalibacillus caeni]|uniref:DUF421 domain-containing protein n=1 Tax=Exobacillus caeni TaxID=2574798 RepID=A0A5R9FAI6_9BACL|nr:YetF domain-containing protein [Pseudalkalibacillus caeni]TLS39206.1 DUF421 domain-containing protein [Pseudalkalibacillus caeni]